MYTGNRRGYYAWCTWHSCPSVDACSQGSPQRGKAHGHTSTTPKGGSQSSTHQIWQRTSEEEKGAPLTCAQRATTVGTTNHTHTHAQGMWACAYTHAYVYTNTHIREEEELFKLKHYCSCYLFSCLSDFLVHCNTTHMLDFLKVEH